MAIANIAFEATQSATPVSLHNFNSTPVLHLALNVKPADPNQMDVFYVIWGRVVIDNLDGSPQNGGAALMAGPGAATQIDSANIRISQDDSTPDPTQAGGQTVSLLARLKLPVNTPDFIVQINGWTYNGTATQARLIAISVDGFG